jgi:hypothetical protein
MQIYFFKENVRIHRILRKITSYIDTIFIIYYLKYFIEEVGYMFATKSNKTFADIWTNISCEQ